MLPLGSSGYSPSSRGGGTNLAPSKDLAVSPPKLLLGLPPPPLEEGGAATFSGFDVSVRTSTPPF